VRLRYYARKVLPNRRLLERPSPTGFPGMRAVSSQLEPQACTAMTAAMDASIRRRL
jgi:hypothetical protein